MPGCYFVLQLQEWRMSEAGKDGRRALGGIVLANQFCFPLFLDRTANNFL